MLHPVTSDTQEIYSSEALVSCFLLDIEAEVALALEEPVLPELRLPGVGVQHGVDVADGGGLPRPQLPLRHHAQLLAPEHDRAARGARVVNLQRSEKTVFNIMNS